MRYSEDEIQWFQKFGRLTVSNWKNLSKDIQSKGHKMLQREARNAAITIIEDAARTEEDFQKVVVIWMEIERIGRWRVDKHMQDKSADELLYPDIYTSKAIIPNPLGHVWWRKLLGGDFNDTIHDCPHELHELTASNPIHDYTKELDDNRKEILYYRAIRLWTPQQIAAMRGQTDRNIRKVYDKMIGDIREKMFKRLYPRYERFLPLTINQIALVEKYITETGEGEIRDEEDKEKYEALEQSDEDKRFVP